MLLKDFFQKQPPQAPLGELEEIELWNSFWKFLKKETDLCIINPLDELITNPLYGHFINGLTQGRGVAKFTHEPLKTYKHELKSESPFSVYFLNESDDAEKMKFRKKNGFVIGFNDDYIDGWSKLKMLHLPTSIPIRKTINDCIIKTWYDLKPFILPFTDVVMVDSYILSDPSLVPSNLEQIMKVLDESTPVKYNFTLVTFEGGRKGQIDYYYDMLLGIKRRHGLKATISLLLCDSVWKEHDRFIMTNYTRWTSGDSFNYFDAKGQLVTKGTEMHVLPLVDPELHQSSSSILQSLRLLIAQYSQHNASQRVKGEIEKNKLLYDCR